ncbi:MAG: hypothetical protein IPM39_12270 [Chloroflexi bacterium]|nr:hypothetical protein [Chloroflexota bacterium]
MNTISKTRVNYRLMNILALIVGIIGIAFLFLPDFELLSFMLTVAVLGGLIGGSNGYEERERLQLRQGYQKAFNGLLLVVMAAYSLIEFSKWFILMEAAATFLNNHWPGLILSVMCIAMGIAGLQKARMAGSV